MGREEFTFGWTRATKLISKFLCLKASNIEYANTAAPSRKRPSLVMVIAKAIRRSNGVIAVVETANADAVDVLEDAVGPNTEDVSVEISGSDKTGRWILSSDICDKSSELW